MTMTNWMRRKKRKRRSSLLGDMPEGRLLALMAQEVRASVHTYVQPLLLIHLPGRND